MSTLLFAAIGTFTFIFSYKFKLNLDPNLIDVQDFDFTYCRPVRVEHDDT
jgi:hypothetical protein